MSPSGGAGLLFDVLARDRDGEPRRPGRRSRTRATAGSPASTAGPGPGIPVAACGRTTALEAVRLAVEPGQFRAGIRAYTTRMICSARSGAAVNTRSVVMKAVWLRMDEDTMPADTNVLVLS